MQRLIDLTVIVCTRDRREAVLRCLRSLAASAAQSTDVHAEVVVVDDGSIDGTSAEANIFAGTTPLSVRVVRGSGRGLGAARNVGVRHASGRLLAFVDDDCLVAPGYLADVVRAFEADDGLVLRGGKVELGDPADAPITIRTSPDAAALTRGLHPGGFVLGCNMAMCRPVLQQTGPFDERLGAGTALKAAEDTDVALRAFLLGIEVKYDPSFVVYHHHGRRTAAQVAGVLEGYNIGNGALLLKHARRAPWLLRHTYWTARNAAKEMLGGPLFDQILGLSHGPIVRQNLTGAALFVRSMLMGQKAWDDETSRGFAL